MIKGKFTIIDVDYEKSIQELYPVIIRESESVKLPGTVLKIVSKIGDISLPVLLKIMGYMTETEKRNLLVWGLNAFNRQIRDALNRFLSEHEFGKAIQIGEIRAVKAKDSNGILLAASDIQINLDKLLQSKLVNRQIDSYADKFAQQTGIKGMGLLKDAAKVAMKAGAKIAPETMEKKGIDILNRPDIVAKVTEILSDGLMKQGLYLKIQDVALRQCVQSDRAKEQSSMDRAADGKQSELKIPKDIEKSLIDAVIKYLKNGK